VSEVAKTHTEIGCGNLSSFDDEEDCAVFEEIEKDEKNATNQPNLDRGQSRS
jgi:hypothetical protein